MKELDIPENPESPTPSIIKRTVVGFFGKRPLVLVALFLATISACSPESGVESRATLDLSYVSLSTPTQEPQILEPENATCINDARFVEDLTVPDGYPVDPGEVLDKRWGVLNAGSCDWGAGYRLVRIDDGLIEAPGELALYPARAGETAVWSIQITAPDQGGDQLASWQAQTPDGTFFGDPVFVLIEVGP